MYNTKFYYLLESAKDNPDDLEKVILEVMPTINNKSLVCKEDSTDYQTDEDLKSELIEYLIKLVKSDTFANKLANESMNEND